MVFGLLQEHSKLKGKSVSAPLDVEGVESSPSAFSDIAGNDGDQRLWTKLKNETWKLRATMARAEHQLRLLARSPSHLTVNARRVVDCHTDLFVLI